jgi:hypothetical protein
METIKFGLIGKQDIKRGRSTYETTLADGRVVSLEEVNLDSFDKILSEDDSVPGGITNILTVRHTTIGTPAAGIGSRITYQAESADESPSDLGALEATFDDVTAGSEDSTFWMLLRTAGAALGRRFGFRSTGAFQTLFTAAPTADRVFIIPDASDTLVGKATTDTLTNKTLTDSLHNAGTGTETFRPEGVINLDTTSGATIADTAETTLITYTLPANTLNVDGKGLRIKVAGGTLNDANGKTIRLYFGSTVLMSNDVTTTPNNQSWVFEGEVFRTGATTQKCISKGMVGAAPQTATYTGAGETLSSAIVIKVTGQNGSAVANEITAQLMKVEFLN